MARPYPLNERTLMRFLLLLPLLLVGCDTPTSPTSTTSDDDIFITNIINIDGDSGCRFDCGKPDVVDPEPEENRPPSLVVPSTITSEVGESVNADIVASDPDGDSVDIDFDPQSAPRNCTISPTGPLSARIACVISPSSPQDSPYTVRVTGDDGVGGRATAFFVWVVNAPPEV